MNIDFKQLPDKNWVVLHTRSRREKKVADYCQQNSITNYLPLERRYQQYERKKITTTLPLFPGYLFCCIDEKERYDLLMTHQLARVIPVVDQRALLNDLEKIYLAQHAGLDLKPSQHFTQGQKVKITSGPLAGYEGFVQRLKGKARLILNVDFIGQAAAVEIEPFILQSLN